jgi:hypothetical protein
MTMADKVSDKETCALKGDLKEGQEAVKRIKNNHWQDWIKLGRALVAGSRLANKMVKAKEAKNYSMAYSKILGEYQLLTINKNARADLLLIMDKLDAVEKWRNASDDKETLNYPCRVWEKFSKAHGLKSSAQQKRLDKAKAAKAAAEKANTEAEAIASKAQDLWEKSEDEDDPQLKKAFEKKAKRVSAESKKAWDVAKKADEKAKRIDEAAARAVEKLKPKPSRGGKETQATVESLRQANEKLKSQLKQRSAHSVTVESLQQTLAIKEAYIRKLETENAELKSQVQALQTILDNATKKKVAA